MIAVIYYHWTSLCSLGTEELGLRFSVYTLLKSFSMHERFFQFLHQQLQIPLPGATAQQKMASSVRQAIPLRTKPDAYTRIGAVLILLYPHEGQLYIPFIQRPVYKGVHSGQVALPGGRVEETDADLVETALREAFEEVGVIAKQIQVVGMLSPLFVHASNFMVHPVVGITHSRPDFKLNAFEVDRLLEVPLAELLDISRMGTKEIMASEGIVVDAPYYDLQGHTLWGATAMIISELLEVVRAYKG
jgi:8-oxo-dGTP pyrophosphatase MutT (NUDIX family)